MKTLFAALLLISFTTTYTSAWWFIKTKNWPVTARGCIRCYNQPMRHVKVQLKDKDGFLNPDDVLKTGRTDSNGCFRLSGRGRDGTKSKPQPLYIRVEYQYSGSNGRMEVEGLVFGKNHGGKSWTTGYNRNLNFGNINFNSMNCKAYTSIYDAMKNFKTRTGLPVPVSTVHVRTGVLIHGGTAYTTRSIIRFPNKYTPNHLSSRLARHELAHAVRHTLDGSSVHFAWDAVRFWYLRNHHCGLRTNEGYAFNEGWALFWANECWGSYGSSTDYHYEGNVAKGLRRLRSQCNSSDRKFIQLLQRSRGKIHSFKKFNNRHKALYGCKI